MHRMKDIPLIEMDTRNVSDPIANEQLEHLYIHVRLIEETLAKIIAHLGMRGV